MTLTYPHRSSLSLTVRASHPYIPARLFLSVYFPFPVYSFHDYSVFLIILLKKHIVSDMLQLVCFSLWQDTRGGSSVKADLWGLFSPMTPDSSLSYLSSHRSAFLSDVNEPYSLGNTIVLLF